jgi:hypothetical protein
MTSFGVSRITERHAVFISGQSPGDDSEMMFISELIVHHPKQKKDQPPNDNDDLPSRKWKFRPLFGPFVLRWLFRRIFHPHTPFGVAGRVNGRCCLS